MMLCQIGLWELETLGAEPHGWRLGQEQHSASDRKNDDWVISIVDTINTRNS